MIKFYLPLAVQMSVNIQTRPSHPLKAFAISVGKFIFETPTEVTACGVGGIAAKMLFPAFAPACFGAVCSVMLTRITVRVLDHLNWTPLKQIIRKTFDLQEKHPKIKVIAFIFALTLGLINSIASLTISVVLGIYYGITVQVRHFKKMQTINRKQIN